MLAGNECLATDFQKQRVSHNDWYSSSRKALYVGLYNYVLGALRLKAIPTISLQRQSKNGVGHKFLTCYRLLAPTGAFIVMMCYHISINLLGQIFTQSINAIDVTRVA